MEIRWSIHTDICTWSSGEDQFWKQLSVALKRALKEDVIEWRLGGNSAETNLIKVSILERDLREYLTRLDISDNGFPSSPAIPFRHSSIGLRYIINNFVINKEW